MPISAQFTPVLMGTTATNLCVWCAISYQAHKQMEAKMKAKLLIAGTVCFVILACAIIYIVMPNTEHEKASEDTVTNTDVTVENKSNTDSIGKQEKSVEAPADKSTLEKPDWLKEPKREELVEKFNNPWKDFDFTDELLGDEFETAEVDITDPASYDALRNEMVKQFGETTGVENYMQTWLKVVSEPDNMKHKADFTKAVYALSPTPETKRSMEIFDAIANRDLAALQKYSANTQEDTRFKDVQRFFEGNPNHAEGFRKLREFDPKRSAEFEEFILEQALQNPETMDAEKIIKDIEESYKNDRNKAFSESQND